MAASSRKSQVRIAYASSANQSAFGTPQANGALTAVFPLNDTAPQFEIVTQDDEIVDCSGQYLLKKVVLAKSSRLSFGIFVDPDVLFRLFGLALGVVASDVASMLGPSSF